MSLNKKKRISQQTIWVCNEKINKCKEKFVICNKKFAVVKFCHLTIVCKEYVGIQILYSSCILHVFLRFIDLLLIKITIINGYI